MNLTELAKALKPIILKWHQARFIPLTTPLISASWTLSAYSSNDPATQLDLSAVFGVLPGIKAILFECEVKDSAAWGTTNLWFRCGPSAIYYYATGLQAFGDDVASRGSIISPCDANGDVWYRVNASGASTLDVTLRVWGYWI